MTLTKKLRDAALTCSNVHYRTTLRLWADEVEHAVKAFAAEADDDNLRYLNGCWAAAACVLANVPQVTDPLPPLSGAPEPARLAA